MTNQEILDALATEYEAYQLQEHEAGYVKSFDEWKTDKLVETIRQESDRLFSALYCDDNCSAVPSPEYKHYRRTQIAEMADWERGFDMTNVSISGADKAAGSPKPGDKIARNPANHDDRWLVAKAYFEANFEAKP